MSLLEWNDKFAIGLPEVDREHQALISLINTLHDAFKRDGRIDAAVTFLGELHAQIAAHFALEERVMRARWYVGYADHKADHERLLDEIREIMDGFEFDRRYDSLALGATLSKWFGDHFRTEDAKLHEALSRKR